MKRDLVVAGKGFAGAGLTGAVLYLVATVPAHVRLFWPYGIFLAMVVVGVVSYLAGQEHAPAGSEQPGERDHADDFDRIAKQELEPNDPAMVLAGPVITDRWRQTSDGGQVPSLMTLTHTVMLHPGYGGRQAEDAPPSVKIGMLVACQPIDPAASGTELRAKFAAFLETKAVRTLIGSLTHVGPGMSWKSLAGNGPRTMEAALTTGDDAMKGVPAASALLLPPVAGESPYGRDGRSATLLLYVEPRTADGQVPSASGLATWYERFDLALAVPGAFAEFLAKDLGLGTSADPPAQLGVWLQSNHPLTVMVDPQDLRTLPGSSRPHWFMGWTVATPDGRLGKETARDLLSQLCEYTLHLDAFEQRLDEISAADRRASVTDTWQSREVPVLTAVIRVLDETKSAQVTVSEIVEACGLSPDEAAAAVQALDGTYLTLQRTLGAADSWIVSRPTDAARRVVGQWPN